MWALFKHHNNTKHSSTSFAKSTMTAFSAKLMLDELLLLHLLQTKRRPDIYDPSWNCILCYNDKETWSHLWQYIVLKPILISLRDETKAATLSLIKVDIEDFLSIFDNS